MQALSVASAKAQIATLEDILNQDRNNLILVQSSFQAGAVSNVDVLSVESQLTNDTTPPPSLRQQQNVARHALSVLLGRPPGSWSAPDIQLSEFAFPRTPPAGMPSELVHHRPDILAAESQLHAATAAVGIATSNLYPHISLSRPSDRNPRSSQACSMHPVTPGALLPISLHRSSTAGLCLLNVAQRSLLYMPRRVITNRPYSWLSVKWPICSML
jgi:outer membrane protein TolC